MIIPNYTDVVEAHRRICDAVHKTPVLTSKSIDAMFESTIFFKCENFQKVGAFKFRGATNAVLSLSDIDAAKGVATHSSGNHAAALALAARNRGIKAFVVMPINAPEIKKRAVKGYGAEITFCEPTLEARETTLMEVVQKTGATVVHPYNNFQVIAGQGTCAKELLEEIPNLDIVLVPVGGGGLLAGSALSAKTICNGTKIIACEPAGADDAYRSFRDGIIHPSIHPQTIADGLLTALGAINFEIIREKVDGVVTVSEKGIVDAMRIIWERMKIIVEPSSAVPLAAILEGKVDVKNKRIGILVSGGNVDLQKLPF